MSKAKPSSTHPSHLFGELRHSPEQIRDLFRSGKFPYKTRIKASAYEKHKEELQVELLKVQNWVKQTGQRIVTLFEGRDAAGKGGTIKRFMEHLNPREARVVAPAQAHRFESSLNGIFNAMFSHLARSEWRNRFLRPLLVQPGRR